MALAIEAGIRFFQYRAKRATRRVILIEAEALAQSAQRAGALFIVNDHADIAVASGAHGVHLGQDDLPLADARQMVGPGRLIGISTHSREQAMQAERCGADYIGFGPIFATTTKDAGKTQGTAALSAIRQSVSLPIIAIGGITLSTAREVQDAGADGLAVISAVLKASDPGRAAAELVRLAKRR